MKHTERLHLRVRDASHPAPGDQSPGAKSPKVFNAPPHPHIPTDDTFTGSLKAPKYQLQRAVVDAGNFQMQRGEFLSEMNVYT